MVSGQVGTGGMVCFDGLILGKTEWIWIWIWFGSVRFEALADRRIFVYVAK